MWDFKRYRIGGMNLSQPLGKIGPLLLILVVGATLIFCAPVNVEAQTGDFILTVSPSRVTIGADGIGRFSVRLTSVNGFEDTIKLDVRGISTTSYSQASYSFEPSVVNLAADSDAYSVMTLIVATQYGYQTYYPDQQYPSEYGYYNLYMMKLTVVATSGSITQQASIIADVYYGYSLTRPDLTINLQPGNIVTSGEISQAKNQALTITVTATTAQGTGNFQFTVTPQFYDPPGGIYASFNPISAQVNVGQTIQFAVDVLMTPEFLAKSGTYRLAVGINALLPRAVSYYRSVIITKVAIVTIVVPPSFSVTTNPAILNVYIGGQDQKMQVIVTPISTGINQPISLRVEGVPQGIVAIFETDTLTPKGREPVSTYLVFSGPSTYESKIYPIQIVAQTLGFVRTVNASIYLQPMGDFIVTAQQTTIALNARGDSKSTTLTLAPQGGFRATIYFSVSQLPAGVTAAFSSSSATIQSDQPVTVVFTLTAAQNAAPGTYNVAIVCGTGLSTKTVIVTLLVRSGIYETWPIVLIVVAIIAAVTVVVFIGIPRKKPVYVLKEGEKKLLPK